MELYKNGGKHLDRIDEEPAIGYKCAEPKAGIDGRYSTRLVVGYHIQMDSRRTDAVAAQTYRTRMIS